MNQDPKNDEQPKIKKRPKFDLTLSDIIRSNSVHDYAAGP